MIFSNARSVRAAITLGVALSLGCGKTEKEAPAATVSHAIPEAELSTITLSPQAEARLGVRTAPIERKRVADTRSVGGEVVVPSGKSLVVTAPVAGSILAGPGGSIPLAGTTVTRDQLMAELVPLPAEPSRAGVDLSVAEARYSEARLEAERTAKLYTDRLVSARDFERSRADLRAAEATLRVARAQETRMSGGAPIGRSALTALAIRAPVSGVVGTVFVAPGQTVAAAAPLFELAQLDRVWVRVPLYVGDVSSVRLNQSVAISRLGEAPGGVVLIGRPVSAPPSANAAAASADLFFEVAQGARLLRPGERVSVTITLGSGETEQLVVPWSAILHDAQGGTWVYEKVKPQVYTRRRVDVQRIVGDQAVLARGPAPGTQVVTDGAAELYGTEFGAGH